MPDSAINMTVFRRSGRKFFECEWVDPITGKRRTRSTKKTTKTQADRFAWDLEKEIIANRYRGNQNITWDDFCTRYEAEVIASLAKRTAEKWQSTANAVETIINPKLLRTLDASLISRFQSKLRENGLAESSIKGHLAHLKAALRWAKSKEMIAAVPDITMPKRANGMKGRPITAEEFERMLSKVPAVVTLKPKKGEKPKPPDEIAALTARVAASWEYLLRGLWLSGLRLGEALDLHWTDHSKLCVDLTGRRPKIRIQADGQKANRYEESPIAPEFAELLLATPPEQRKGFVFAPLRRDGDGQLSRIDTVSDLITEIGQAAGVIVAEKPNRRKRKDGSMPTSKTKYASAHDLRRAFGFRWSLLVMPAQLQQLMRHESITTTMEFYVGRNAEAAADALYAALESRRSRSPDTLPDTSVNAQVDSEAFASSQIDGSTEE
jgi:integrase